jgi:serine O-acetyltransferase
VGLRADLRADFARTREMTGGKLRRAPFSVVATVTFRLGHAAKLAEHNALALLAYCVCQLLTGADIHPGATLGPGIFFVHTQGVTVGPGVVTGRRLTLYGGTVIGGRQKTGREWGYPVLGDNVILFAKASIIGPVTVGDDVQVGAHALLLDDAPAGARIRGPQPATVPVATV